MEAVRVLDAAFELAARLGELMDEALDAQGLTPPRAELVLALHQHGEPMVQRALARVLRCTPRHITGLVERWSSVTWCAAPPTPPIGGPSWSP